MTYVLVSTSDGPQMVSPLDEALCQLLDQYPDDYVLTPAVPDCSKPVYRNNIFQLD